MERDPVAHFPLPSPFMRPSPGFVPSSPPQRCILWYILWANSHVMFWLLWQFLKQSGWNFLVFPYYAFPSQYLRNRRSTNPSMRYFRVQYTILLWLLSYRLASIYKFWERESHLVFQHNDVSRWWLFACLFLPRLYFINSQSLHVNTWLGRMSYRLCSSFQPNAATFNVVLFSFPSSPQRDVEKLKVVLHRQPPALQAKIVIFWWPTMPQTQLMLNSSWAGKETGWQWVSVMTNLW